MGDQVRSYCQVRGDGRWAQGTTSRIGEETMNSTAILEGSLMSYWVREMKKRDSDSKVPGLATRSAGAGTMKTHKGAGHGE